MKQEAKRLDYIDVAKGIAILLVIVGHTFTVWKVKVNWIFTFHTPLFFILSGFFFKSGKKTPLYKLFKALIIPYLGINFIIVLFYAIRNGFTLSVVKKLLGVFYGNASATNVNNCLIKLPTIGMTWFLLALFWCRVIYNELDKLSKNFNFSLGLATIILAFASMELNKYICLPFSIMPGITAMLFYHAGRCMREQNTFDVNIKQTSPIIVVLCIVLWLCSSEFGQLRLNANFIKLVVDIIIAIVLTYFVVMLSKQILKIPVMGKFLKWCGKYSMDIYGFHAIDPIILHEFFKLMPSFNKIDSWGEYFVYLFIRLAVDVLLAFIFVVAKNKLKSTIKNRPKKNIPAEAE